MRTLRGAVACVIAVAAAAIAGSAPAQAAAPASPYKAMVLTPPGYGNWIVGENVSYDESNATFQLSSDPGGNGVSMWAGNDGEGFSMSFGAPTGQTLTAGTTYQSRRFSDATYAGMNLGAPGRGCNQEFGWFTIKEIQRNAEDLVSAFAATFAAGCESATHLIPGEVRWNSTVPYTGKVGDADAFAFGPQEIGMTSDAKTLTITSTGSDATVFGTAVLQGTAPQAFLISADTCSGTSRTYGQTCTVSVKAKPMTDLSQEATLLVPDNTVGGGKLVRLSTSGYKGATGTYYPLFPQRMLDTRNGTGATAGAVGSGGTINLQINGNAGVPLGAVAAVVLNVTVTAPTSSGHITVYPSGNARPTASSLNFVPGWTGANSVTVPIGSDGKISLYNSAGNTHLIADLIGYYADRNPFLLPIGGIGGHLFTHSPTRVLDTRTDFEGKLPSGYYATVPMDYGNDINTHVRAVIVNITAVEPHTAGYLSSWNGKWPLPTTSTLNYTAGGIVPNLAIVPTAPCSDDCDPGYESLPMIGVYTNQDTHVIVDVVGYLDDSQLAGGLKFKPNNPTRIADSRIGQGLSTRIGPAATASITAPSALASSDTRVLALNVTAVVPTTTTHMTVWATGSTKPATSNLNPAKGQIIPNAVVTRINSSRQFNVYNNGGYVDVVVDVVGTFYAWNTSATSTASAGVPLADETANQAPRPVRPTMHKG